MRRKQPQKQIRIEIPAQLHDAIKSEAARRRVSMSALMRSHLGTLPMLTPKRVPKPSVRKLIK
jgi:hypothetical protein